MGKEQPISDRERRAARSNVERTILLSLAIFHIMTFGCNATGFCQDRHRKTIVLDPGHGGKDPGARGPSGTLEKNANLNMARILSETLGRNHNVVLTRLDDYDLGPFQRTSIANHQAADIFISIHAAAGFDTLASGATVFHHLDKGAPDATDTAPSADGSVGDQWDRLQERHMERSRKLSETIARRLKNGDPDFAVRTAGAPIMVLEGADMPAIMLETGHITHPEEEKALTDPDRLRKLSRKIADAIDDFFEKMP